MAIFILFSSVGISKLCLNQIRTYLFNLNPFGFKSPIATFAVASADCMPLRLRPNPSLNEKPSPDLTLFHSKSHYRPHLIAILMESLFDPRLVSKHPISKELTDFFGNGENPNYLSGTLRVQTTGGGTWTSEFGFLAGVPSSALGTAGFYAPLIMPGKIKKSVVSELRDLGYKTIALYPIRGDFINAKNFYLSLGFDEFYDINDLGLSDGWAPDDSLLYQAALRKISENSQKKTKAPLFIFILTLETHGPWSKSCLNSGLPFDDRIIATMNGSEKCEWQNYLERLEKSSSKFAQFKQELGSLFSKDSFSIIHFGDHQPTLSSELFNKGALAHWKHDDLFRTYFKIDHELLRYASHPVHKSSPQVSEINLGYLTSLWISSVGLPLSPYFRTRLELLKKCNGDYPTTTDHLCSTDIQHFHGDLIQTKSITF